MCETLPNDWRKTSLKNVANIRFSGVDKKSKPGERKVKLCNYIDVYDNEYITREIPFMEATASISEIETFSVSEGDVMITKDSETPFDIGVPSVVSEPLENVICGYHLAHIKPKLEEIERKTKQVEKTKFNPNTMTRDELEEYMQKHFKAY